MGDVFFFFFSSRRRHTRWTGDWSSDVCSSDLDCHAGARHESLIEEVDLPRRRWDDHAVLRVGEDFANGSYGNVNLTRRCVLEVTNVIEVRDTLKEQVIRASSARAGGHCRCRDLKMVMHEGAVHLRPATHQQRGQFEILEEGDETGRNGDRKLRILS